MEMRRFALGTAIVLIASSLSGCAATTSGRWATETTPVATPGPVVDPQTADGSMPQPNGPMRDMLDHFWGTDLDPAEQVRSLESYYQRREGFIVQCMLEQGFEYQVIPSQL